MRLKRTRLAGPQYGGGIFGCKGKSSDGESPAVSLLLDDRTRVPKCVLPEREEVPHAKTLRRKVLSGLEFSDGHARQFATG